VHITQETPAQTDERLRRIATTTSVEVLTGDWWYDEFPATEFPARVRADAVALVRDRSGWCQLVPVSGADRPRERFRIWCCHFPEGIDNSGFVGWLASRIKMNTGSGIFVVCGQNSRLGGIYDYWGCPVEAADAVLSEVLSVSAGTSPPRHHSAGEPASLDGVRMRAVRTAGAGEVDADTLFTFTQEGSTVWAHYAGGAVQVGYLVGRLASGRLSFRYSQVDRRGAVHGGRSVCDIEVLPDGRVRLLEHFQWESREGSGTNVLEEQADSRRAR
jgi:hypothetical protein